MPFRCCIVNCRGNYRGSAKVRVFRLPSDQLEKKRWLSAIPPHSRKDSISFRICELHWPEDAQVKRIAGGSTRPTDPPTVFNDLTSFPPYRKPGRPKGSKQVKTPARSASASGVELYKKKIAIVNRSCSPATASNLPAIEPAASQPNLETSTCSSTINSPPSVASSPPSLDTQQRLFVTTTAAIMMSSHETPTSSSQKDWIERRRVVKVENLSPMVTNERLRAAFSIFGEIVKATVIVDNSCQSTTNGIVEFRTSLSAQNAVKRIEEGCYLISSFPKPIEATLMENVDAVIGLPEEKITKTTEYFEDTKAGPRFASIESFEEEVARTFKLRYKQERQQRQQFEDNIKSSRLIFEAQMLECWKKQQLALQIKQEMMSQSQQEEKLQAEHLVEQVVEARKRSRVEEPNEEINQTEEAGETPSKKICFESNQSSRMQTQQLVATSQINNGDIPSDLARMDNSYTIDRGTSNLYRSGGFEYLKRNANGKKIFLKCRQDRNLRCYGTAHIDIETDRFSLCMSHNHSPKGRREIIQDNFRRELKEKSEHSNKSSAAVYKEVAEKYKLYDLGDISLEAMRRTMNKRKSKVTPDEPNNFDEIVPTMIADKHLNEGYQGVIKRGNETVAIIFYSKEGITKFHDFNTIIYKTYIKLRPVLCGELTIISAKHEESFSPAIMIWFKYKDDTQAQIDAFFLLRMKLLTFRPLRAIGNYSTSIEKALQNVYKEIKINICFYFFEKHLKEKLNELKIFPYSESNEIFQQVLLLIKSIGLLQGDVRAGFVKKLCQIEMLVGSVRKKKNSRTFFSAFNQQWTDRITWLEWSDDAYESYKFQRDFDRFWARKFCMHYKKTWDFVCKCGEMVSDMGTFFTHVLEDDEIVRNYLHLTAVDVGGKGFGQVEMLAENLGMELHQNFRKLFNVSQSEPISSLPELEISQSEPNNSPSEPNSSLPESKSSEPEISQSEPEISQSKTEISLFEPETSQCESNNSPSEPKAQLLALKADDGSVS